MAFGQPLGPPATRRQLDELLSLVHRAGHDGFRDARGPLGLTQRQANGKFTRDEADAFITELTAQTEPTDLLAADPATGSETTSNHERHHPTAAERRRASQDRALSTVPSDVLAAELQRRGWAVIEP